MMTNRESSECLCSNISIEREKRTNKLGCMVTRGIFAARGKSVLSLTVRSLRVRYVCESFS